MIQELPRVLTKFPADFHIIQFTFDALPEQPVLPVDGESL
jgi:hypothetical protein